ncbi:hypothetical protein PR048_022185 [Dryococelus australis]|uniref:DUF4371 domain-containing protein n=1 Tax=Dryococelus australis TaxID=614101 RepID=A0ABQ9H0D7_9NEOP|nr:hypothetical protein PR048_022185 [Dryococelus australis]
MKYLTLKIGCFKRHNWLSHDIQNEILQLLSLTVVRNLNQDIKKNKYFALIADEMIDNSTKEQVSISLQHVNDDFDVCEDFIGLYETSLTTGDTLAGIVEDVLLRLYLRIEDCRGQCYDGAKNMSGHMKGAQAVISSKENRAIYIYCFSHSLNVSLIHASSTNVLENVHTLAKFFNESAKRTSIFLNYKADDDPALAKNTTLKPQCPTSLKSKESLANGLSAFFEKTSSLFYLKVSVIVFGFTVELARNLQTSDISITLALRHTEIVMRHLTDLKTEEKFTELWEKVKKRGEDIDLQPVSLPRVRKPPKLLEHNINACITTMTPSGETQDEQ